MLTPDSLDCRHSCCYRALAVPTTVRPTTCAVAATDTDRTYKFNTCLEFNATRACIHAECCVGAWQVGVMHTNYSELSRRTLGGAAGALVGVISHVMNALLCSIHTHKARTHLHIA